VTDPSVSSRSGEPPATTDTNPHKQLSQTPSRELYTALAKKIFSLSDAVERPSQISVPGARALVLAPGIERGPREAFLVGREFCHLHPPSDGSLHMALPPDVAAVAVRRGWAETHPMAERGFVPRSVVMVYGPRGADELDIVFSFVRESYRYAGGRD
jgi:hypothetical protein